MRHKAYVAAFVLATASVAEAQENEQWDWTIAPYLWASDVGLDLTVNDDATIGGDAAFRDLLDKVDNVFMGHFEGRKGHWGMYLDTIYLDLGESKVVSVGPGGPILGDLAADAGMKMKLFDAGGLYRLSEPGADVQFDLLAGVRYIDADVDLSLTLPGPGMRPLEITTGPSETDLMLGARIIRRFAGRWHWALRGDFSVGGTEGTYNGLASMGYTFGESGLFTLTAGYRYTSIGIRGATRGGNPTEVDVTMSGPILGFIFKF
jgi:hypothetical protein